MISTDALVEKFRYALENNWGYIWGTAGIQWTQARQKQKVDYMVSKYGTSWQKNSEARQDNYYMCAVYGSKWIGHTVADCSGLFSWSFSKLGGYVPHGSNSIFKGYCSASGKLASGKRTDGKTLLPGTAVFTGDEKSHGHIGLYAGNGKVIEAASTQAGVCTSNITAGKWTWWGELKGVQYGVEPGKPTLRMGDKGEDVKKAQELLLKHGYDLGRWGADGDFGSATLAAVKKFQEGHGLNPDGVIGEKTWTKLEEPPAEAKYVATVPNLTMSQAKELCNQYPGASYKEMSV